MGAGHPYENHYGFQYELAGYRLDGEWFDVEKGARLPTDEEWDAVDLVTVNLAPESDDGFYRSAPVIGLHPPGTAPDEFDLGDVVDQLASAYGFET